jgi:peptidyl-tRNA hydrolase, PTH2 family
MKLAIILNDALGMSKGKLCSQAAHAAVGAYRVACSENATLRQQASLQLWLLSGEPKIVLRVTGEEKLLQLGADAKKSGLACSIVRDAGHTQVAPGSVTAVGFLGSSPQVDEIAGSLKLL